MASSRKIPATMATQHPDNAGAAWWLGRSYIDTKSEIVHAAELRKSLG